MKIALVIVNYNSGGLLKECLTAVDGQTRRPNRVVVVDNASADDSLSGIAETWPHVEMLRLDRNAGFAVANNRAIERCGDCDWIALLNPDAFPDPGWLAALEAAARAVPEAGSLASCLVNANDPAILDGMGDAYHVSGLVWRIGHGEPVPEAQVRREVFAPCAAAAMYRREAIEQAGGFDESYFCYNEDVDLGFRMRLLGMTCWYVPEARVRHIGSAVTGVHSDFSLFYGHRNLVWTYVKNMPRGLFLRTLWQHLLLNLVSVVGLSVRYRTLAVIQGKLSAIQGLPRVWRQRRDIQRKRTATNSALLAVMTSGWWRAYFGRSL